MFPGMRVLIGTMIRSVPMIANVMLLTVFFFIIFGIFGLLVFMGALKTGASPSSGTRRATTTR